MKSYDIFLVTRTRVCELGSDARMCHEIHALLYIFAVQGSVASLLGVGICKPAVPVLPLLR